MIFVLLSFMAVSASAQTIFDRGDANGDGNVDISDVVLLVNMVLNGGDVHLTCPDNHHPHLIDLGLPSGTKWACCNVGADTPEAYGGYYAWGETKEKQVYNWSTYIYCNGSSDTCHDLGSDIAGTQYDVAHVKWGGEWRMPTSAEVLELRNNTTSEWTSVNGVAGRKYRGSNGGTIFIPAAGYLWHSDFSYVGSMGYYLSSTLHENYKYSAYCLSFNNYGTDRNRSDRYFGLSVRPVR